MNIINLTFFTLSFFISQVLLCGDDYSSEPNHSLWHSDGPEWVPNAPDGNVEGGDVATEDPDRYEQNHPAEIRLSKCFDYLKEPREEIFLAIYDDDIEALELLLENEENLEVISETSLTPLFYAAMNGKNEIVKLLLKKGAACYISAPSYGSIAHFCIAHKKASALAVVLEHSKEFYSQLDYQGNTLLQSAEANADSVVFDVLLKYSDENGKSYLNFSHRVKNSYNVLFSAAAHKNIWVIGTLIDRYHDQISIDDLVHEGKSIFHVIFGNIGTTDREWCPHQDELMPLITNFSGLLNYIDHYKYQTSLDVLNQKDENCRLILGVNNSSLIDSLIKTIKKHGAKTAEEVRVSLIKSTNRQKIL